jgi:hypothetical protein
MFIPGLQMCTNEITIVGIFFFSNFEYGGANVTDLRFSTLRHGMKTKNKTTLLGVVGT